MSCLAVVACGLSWLYCDVTPTFTSYAQQPLNNTENNKNSTGGTPFFEDLFWVPDLVPILGTTFLFFKKKLMINHKIRNTEVCNIRMLASCFRGMMSVHPDANSKLPFGFMEGLFLGLRGLSLQIYTVEYQNAHVGLQTASWGPNKPRWPWAYLSEASNGLLAFWRASSGLCKPCLLKCTIFNVCY